eukprot:scaffold1821_cov344-Pavlova_lutheri.AAC.36
MPSKGNKAADHVAGPVWSIFIVHGLVGCRQVHLFFVGRSAISRRGIGRSSLLLHMLAPLPLRHPVDQGPHVFQWNRLRVGDDDVRHIQVEFSRLASDTCAHRHHAQERSFLRRLALDGRVARLSSGQEERVRSRIVRESAHHVQPTRRACDVDGRMRIETSPQRSRLDVSKRGDASQARQERLRVVLHRNAQPSAQRLVGRMRMEEGDPTGYVSRKERTGRHIQW